MINCDVVTVDIPLSVHSLFNGCATEQMHTLMHSMAAEPQMLAANQGQPMRGKGDGANDMTRTTTK
jgi:hypothetical protein